MKKIKLLIASVSLICSSASAQTNVSGGIYASTTWTLANSPYIMTGNIVVFPGVVLTIEPGVEVRVKENPLPQFPYYLETRGTINMIGQPGALITFKTDSTPNKIGSWQGFKIKNSQGATINYDYVNISNANETFTYDGSVPGYISLNQCEFRYNGIAVNVGMQLLADSCFFKGNSIAISGWSMFEFNHCVFDSNFSALPIYASELKMESCLVTKSFYGLFFNAAATIGTSIKNTDFTYNKTAMYAANIGVIENCKFLFNEDAINNTYNLLIKNCVIEDNVNGVFANQGTEIRDCEINNNSIGVSIVGLTFLQPAPIIENNRICNNTSYNISNHTDLNLFIPTNCFCEVDSTLIESKILDGYDDITKGLISYAIFDTTCTNVLKVVNKAPGVTAVSENEISTIKLFPNPASDNLNIANEGSFNSLEIYNMTGQLQLKANLSIGTSTIDVSNLKPSMYYVRFTNAELNTKTIRFSKL